MGSPGAGYGSDVIAGVGEGAGLSALGYGLSMNPQLNLQDPMQQWQPDQNAISQQMGTQQDITNQQLGGLATLIGQNLGGIQNLTGQNMSGQQGINQQALGQQAGILGQGLGVQSGINQQGIGQQQGILGQSLMGQQGLNQQSIGQQQGLENQMLGQLQGVDQNQMSLLASQLSPSGSLGQQLAGEYANYGLTPNSGGFQQGLANQFGNLAMSEQQQLANAVGQGYGNVSGAAQTGSNALNSLLGQGTSAVSGAGQTGTNALSGLLGQGTQNLSGQASTGAQNLTNVLGTGTQNQVNAYNTGIGNLASAENQGAQTQSGLGLTGLQNTLGLESQQTNTNNAQALAQFMQQAGLQSSLVGGGLNTTGQSSQGGATGGTWICTEMRKRGILTQEEVTQLHDHLFKVLWKNPIPFIKYFILGKPVVWLGNLLDIDWKEWKPMFFDRVNSEKDPVKAVELYESSCWELVRDIRHRLRIKTLIIYDNPRY